MSKLASALLLILAAAASQPAHAQVTLDLAKVTCEQWSGYKITNPQNIALWLSGYYNGKRGNTVIDTQGWPRRTRNCGTSASPIPRCRSCKRSKN